MAVTRARCNPQTRDYIARKKAEGKTNRDGNSLPQTTPRPPRLAAPTRPRPVHAMTPHQFLDIGAARAGATPDAAQCRLGRGPGVRRRAIGPPPRNCIRGTQQSRSRYRVPCDWTLRLPSAHVAKRFGFSPRTEHRAGRARCDQDVFALTVLPTLYVLGVFTFVRVVECGAEDFRYGVAINRIRNYYKQIAGDQAKLFLLSGHDDGRGVFENAAVPPERRKQFFTFATVVA
jgi:hypothetical protein